MAGGALYGRAPGKHQPRDAGTTLVELVMALVVAAIAAAAAAGAMATQLRVSSAHGARVDEQQAARAIQSWIARDLRSASAAGGAPFLEMAADAVTVRVDDGVDIAPRRYCHDAVASVVRVQSGADIETGRCRRGAPLAGDASSRPLAVSVLRFRYFDPGGRPTPRPLTTDQIRTVAVHIAVRRATVGDGGEGFVSTVLVQPGSAR